MAQFDVYQTRDGDLLLDCQSDLLDDLNTRLVILLARPDGSTGTPARLNPTLVIDGEPWVMKTHFAASVSVGELRSVVASLESERYTILAAIDFMLGGF